MSAEREFVDNGGHAFAAAASGWQFQCGMSLRDWYAGLAMQGIIANTSQGFTPNNIAALSWQIADEMLKRKRETEKADV